MGAKQSTDAEKLRIQYQERLGEIGAIDISEISLGELKNFRKELELELNALDKKKASKLSKEILISFKDQYTNGGSFVPGIFVPGNFVPEYSSLRKFVPGIFVPRIFVPWNFRPPENSSIF